MTKEMHILSDYTTIVEKQSKIVVGKMIVDYSKLVCPKCNMSMTAPEHEQTITCPKCKLKITRYGNRLELED